MTSRVFHALLLGIVFTIAPVTAHAGGVPIIYAPLNPASAVPGGSGFTLTVIGTAFDPAAVVNWNGSPCTTTFVSSSKLTAAISAADIASAGTATITVTNPGSGGGTSNQILFPVASPTTGLAFQDNEVPTGLGLLPIVQSAVGDFNGDGKSDILISSFLANTVYLSFGDGNGAFPTSFIPLEVVPSGATLLNFSVGDINGDGKPDIIASYLDSNVTPSVFGTAILVQNGDGTFQPLKTSPSFSTGGQTVVADFNGDGKPDVVSASAFTRDINLGLNNGDGTFSPAVIFTSPVATNGSFAITSLAVGDFNGDGKLDIAFVAYPRYLAVLFGNGDGTFSAPSLVYDTNGSADAVAVADFDGDGKLDLALYQTQNIQSAANGALSIFLGNGDGTFQEPLTLPNLSETGAPTVLVPGDFNNDGHLDLIAQNVAILIGNGNGPFSHSQISLPGYASLAADFNGDGKLDLFGINFLNNTLHVMLQTAPPPDFSGSANPSFQSVVAGSSVSYSVSISPIDSFSGTVHFSVSGLPPGGTMNFDPATLTGSGTTSLTIGTRTTTPEGSYTVTLTAISGSVVHSGTITLNVGPPGRDFTDFAGSVTPAYQTIAPSSVAHYYLGVSPINGFSGAVNFSVSGLPSGAVATFTPSSVSGSGSAVLAVSVLSTTPTATFPLIVTATSGSHVHSTSVNLNVGPAGTDFTDFTGSITPDSQIVPIGGSVSFVVTILPINGFTQTINFELFGTPPGVTASATASQIAGGSGSSVITLTPHPGATPGTYSIRLQAAAGSTHVHSRTVTLTITP